MNPSLEKILNLSYKYRAIDRDMYYPGAPKPENDAEHSYQLALLAWQIIELDQLPLDQSKVFKLCLAHDLVEVFSGDVPLWGQNGHAEKTEREAHALETIKNSFGNSSELVLVIAEYKARETEESKFVYGLDKLLPFLNQLHIEGRVWKDHNIQLPAVLEKTRVFAQASEYLKKYFDEGEQYLEQNQDKYFNTV